MVIFQKSIRKNYGNLLLIYKYLTKKIKGKNQIDILILREDFFDELNALNHRIYMVIFFDKKSNEQMFIFQ